MERACVQFDTIQDNSSLLICAPKRKITSNYFSLFHLLVIWFLLIYYGAIYYVSVELFIVHSVHHPRIFRTIKTTVRTKSNNEYVCSIVLGRFWAFSFLPCFHVLKTIAFTAISLHSLESLVDKKFFILITFLVSHPFLFIYWLNTLQQTSIFFLLLFNLSIVYPSNYG